MGEVVAPEQGLHTGVVTQADGDRVVKESPQILLPEVVARLPFERLQAPLILNQAAISTVMIVDLPERKRQPAGLRFRPVDVQIGESIEHARERELHRSERRIAAEAIELD